MKILDTYRTGQTGYSNGAPGIVLITDAMPDWNQQQWRDLMKAHNIEPDPKPFEPSYKLVFGVDTFTGRRWEMNSRLFADTATLTFLAQRYGNGKTRETDILGQGGTFVIEAKPAEFQLLDGRWVNAGMIAGFYTDNPEGEFPGVADRQIKAILAKDE